MKGSRHCNLAAVVLSASGLTFAFIRRIVAPKTTINGIDSWETGTYEANTYLSIADVRLAEALHHVGLIHVPR